MRLRTLVPVGAVTAALLLAGCSSGGGNDDGVASLGAAASNDDSSTDTTLSEEEREEALLDWVACMRDQGVDIPDPTVDEDGNLVIRRQVGPGANDEDDESNGPPDFEAIDAARKECGDPPGGGGGGNFTPEDREELQEAELRLAECMREEGITDFPDPDFSGLGDGSGGPVRVRPFGDVDMDDPKVQDALQTCQDRLGADGIGPFGGRGPRD